MNLDFSVLIGVEDLRSFSHGNCSISVSMLVGNIFCSLKIGLFPKESSQPN